MNTDTELLIRRRELVAIGLDDGLLRRSLRAGDLAQVVTGAYAKRAEWEVLKPIEQHRMRVLATSERLRTEVVYSHHAAAALWGIQLLGRWPQLVDVTLERASGGRSDGALRRHCTGLETTRVTQLHGLTITTPAQTIIDLARMLPFADGVAAADSALHRKRRPAPLVTRDELFEVLALAEGKRGFRKAARATEFATDLSDSVEESNSRVQIHLLGFPEPELQRAFVIPSGATFETDFYFREVDHIGECDGRAKYTDPLFLNGRTPQEAVIDEKNRENELRRLVRGFSRWEPRELYPPRRLYDRLTRDGVPTTKRRP